MPDWRPTGGGRHDDPAGRPAALADRGRVPRDRGGRAGLHGAGRGAVADVSEPGAAAWPSRASHWQSARATATGRVEVLFDLDVDLQLDPPDYPGTVHRPDLIVVPLAASARVDDGGGVIRASEVLIAVQVVSPGSKRTDHVEKRSQYADAGIPHYRIVDLDSPVSLLARHLAGEFGYADGGAVTGTFTTSAPFSAGIDLDALLQGTDIRTMLASARSAQLSCANDATRSCSAARSASVRASLGWGDPRRCRARSGRCAVRRARGRCQRRRRARRRRSSGHGAGRPAGRTCAVMSSWLWRRG